MMSLTGAIVDFKRLEVMAGRTSAVHRLDPRVKVVVTLVFILTVVSFGRYEIAALLPFFAFPVAMISIGNLPPLFIAKKIALLCPFVLMVGFFNPLVDREILLHIGPLAISGGWISLASILVRSFLTIGAAFILVGITGFASICQALSRLGMPQIFTVQLLFLYRYILVLSEEVARSSQARELRACGCKGAGIVSFGSLVGHLLLRTWQRAENIHLAMLARGFSGELIVRQSHRFGLRELLFLSGWSLFFITFRIVDMVSLLSGGRP